MDIAPQVLANDELMARRGAPSSPRLLDEIRTFWSNPTPRVIAPLLLVALALRLYMGRWTPWDAFVVGLQIALQPFVEWLIHVYVLHAKPARILGRKYDSHVARKHRAHHGDPRKVEWIFVPIPALLQLFAIMMVLYFLLTPTTRLALTALSSGLTILLTYEWTHYLIHSRYRPRSRFYRYVWRAHRLHHFKNEHYWFGVTMHLGDHVLKTFPDKDAVPTSPTCRTLGEAETV